MATTDPYQEGPFGGLSPSEVGRAILQILRNSATGLGPPITGGSANQEFGGSANQLLSDGETSSGGTVFCIYIVTDAQLGTITAASDYSSSGITSEVFTAGQVIYGKYSSVGVTSGKVIVYYV